MAPLLPSEKLELAMYKYVDALQPPVHVSLPQLSQIVGENDNRKIVERLKDLEVNNRFLLSKYSGGQRWPPGKFSSDAAFFYRDSFLIEIAPPGRKYFEELVVRAEQEGEHVTPTRQGGASGVNLPIFISHSSKDTALAEALTDLLKSALGLVPSQIRCTSVDGHRLPVGVNTENKLREAVNAAKVVIGLVTPSSLGSSYVMFELGARWGAMLFQAPLLAGVKPDDVSGPLRLVNALSASDDAQVHQFLDDVADELGIRLQKTESYIRHVKRVVQLANETPSDLARRPPHQSKTESVEAGQSRLEDAEVVRPPLFSLESCLVETPREPELQQFKKVLFIRIKNLLVGQEGIGQKAESVLGTARIISEKQNLVIDRCFWVGSDSPFVDFETDWTRKLALLGIDRGGVTGFLEDHRSSQGIVLIPTDDNTYKVLIQLSCAVYGTRFSAAEFEISFKIGNGNIIVN